MLQTNKKLPTHQKLCKYFFFLPEKSLNVYVIVWLLQNTHTTHFDEPLLYEYVMQFLIL